MIRLIDKPKFSFGSAESIKINSNYECYSDIALFWEQTESDLEISMLDGNMVICGTSSDIEELKEFINVISPSSIFTNTLTFDLLGLKNITEVSVLSRFFEETPTGKSDELLSNQVYDILRSGGLELPDFENFAVDFCLRKNKGKLKYFAKKDKAVAISIGQEYVLINGVASNEKGYGSICLNGVMSLNKGKKIFVCAKDDVKGFYIKNGFSEEYKAGYWRK